MVSHSAGFLQGTIMDGRDHLLPSLKLVRCNCTLNLISTVSMLDLPIITNLCCVEYLLVGDH